MDILMSETCWANISEIKTTSDIKLVFNSSTIHNWILTLHRYFSCAVERNSLLFMSLYNNFWPIPVAAHSKAWVCVRSLAGIAGSNPAGKWISVVCCQVEVSASGWSLAQTSPAERVGCNHMWSWNLNNEGTPNRYRLLHYWEGGGREVTISDNDVIMEVWSLNYFQIKVIM